MTMGRYSPVTGVGVNEVTIFPLATWKRSTPSLPVPGLYRKAPSWPVPKLPASTWEVGWNWRSFRRPPTMTVTWLLVLDTSTAAGADVAVRGAALAGDDG